VNPGLQHRTGFSLYSALVKIGTFPKATVARLPLYLHALETLAQDAERVVSSDRLADKVKVNAAKVRKDLSFIGSYGVRGVGYDVVELEREIRQALGLTRDYPIAIVGIGNLGAALANYDGFAKAGFFIVGLYDTDPEKIGTSINGVPIRHVRFLEADAAEYQVAIGIIATPPEVAQEIAELLARSGVRSVLNFAPTVLGVPNVAIRRVDLATELQISSYYLQEGKEAPR
jgi:redox-sensing transcriptional repressor